MAFGVDPQAAFQVIRAVREQTAKPVMVKLSPNVTDITEIATAVEAAGEGIGHRTPAPGAWHREQHRSNSRGFAPERGAS